MRLENEQAHGQRIADHAETIWNWSSPAGRIRAERRARLIADYAAIVDSDHCLELGCGTGLFTQKIASHVGAHITAVDLSLDLLAVARSSPTVCYVAADAMHLPFPGETFNVVFGSSVLHHLDILPALTEIRRVLKPNGRLVLAEPNMLNPQIALQKNIPCIKRWLGDSPDETAIIRWKLQKQLAAVGMQEIKITPYDFLHPSTPQFLTYAVERVGRLLERIPVFREIAGSVIITARA
ncbi:MAG: class I SAM-dependent methyltransferase [Proteobacteria bacterium]|nr:class I SAM-dependent methyltransferase [Pseudomonadota bacterium]